MTAVGLPSAPVSRSKLSRFLDYDDWIELNVPICLTDQTYPENLQWRDRFISHMVTADDRSFHALATATSQCRIRGHQVGIK